MIPDAFRTADDEPVPAVTGEEMQSVDSVAVEDVGLSLTRMMEHAGRSLALEAFERYDDQSRNGPIVVLAGGGGNGGGGLVCARHLANRGFPIQVVLDRLPAKLEGVPGQQLSILEHMKVSELRPILTPSWSHRSLSMPYWVMG